MFVSNAVAVSIWFSLMSCSYCTPSPDILVATESQQISLFTKPPWSTHNCFCSSKKKKLSMWGSTHNLDVISTHAISGQKKVDFMRLKLTTFMLEQEALPTRPHKKCPGTSWTSIERTSWEWTSWDHNYVRLAQTQLIFLWRKHLAMKCTLHTNTF